MQFFILIVSCMIISFFLYFIWKKSPMTILIASLFFIEIIWQTISIIWIDCGDYISEQLRNSFFTGASIRFVILIAPFAISLPIFIQRGLNNKKYKKISFTVGKRHKHIINENSLFYCVIIIVLYMFLNLIISGIPLISTNISKNNFYSSYSKLPFCSLIHNYLFPFFMLFLGMRIGNKINKKEKYVFTLLITGSILLYQLLMGNKFYGLYDYVLHFLLPICIINRDIINKRRKTIPWKWIFSTLFATGIILIICYINYSHTKSNPIEYLFNRLFSLQSHTFWGVDLLKQQGRLPIDYGGFLNEVNAGLFSNVSSLNSKYGIARIMYLVTSKTFADDMLSTGFLFAGSYITVMISYLGYFTTFFYSLILSKFISDICILLEKYVNSYHYVIIYFIFFVFRRLYEYFRVGNFAMILEVSFNLFYYLFF